MPELIREKDYLFSFLLGPMFAFVIIFYLLMDSAVSAYESNNALFLNLQLVEEFKGAKDDADVSMILLGNSRLRYGADFGFDPSELTTLPDGRKMAALQYANNAAEFGVYGKIADHILLARPDYIVILDMLLTNSRPPGRSPAVKFAKMVYDAWMAKSRGLDPEEAWRSDRVNRQSSCYAYYTLDFMNNRIGSTAKRDRHSLDPEINENLADIRDFIAKAEESGIDVIILHYPVNSDILDRYDVPYHYLNNYGLGYAPEKEAILPQSYESVTWMAYPAKLDKSHYCDFLHFNKKGRAAFSEWFLDEIARMTGAQ